jgi:glyoxylase-like metal-dependent hydrolase (beta-lactamase superfamily II)
MALACRSVGPGSGGWPRVGARAHEVAGRRSVNEPGWPFGPYPPGGLRRLGPHVVAYHGHAYPAANSAIVRGAEATLVFDANTLRFARALRTAVDEDDGPPLRDLVVSHAHGDHAHGAMHFSPPARTWASLSARDGLARLIGRDLTPFAEELAAEQRVLGVHDPTTRAEYREVRVVVPDRLVDAAGATIELGGGVRVRLHHVENAHTPGDLWAYVEPDEIALCGDLWFNDFEPYIASGSLAGSLAALTDLRRCGAGTWLPGHGPAGSIHCVLAGAQDTADGSATPFGTASRVAGEGPTSERMSAVAGTPSATARWQSAWLSRSPASSRTTSKWSRRS